MSQHKWYSSRVSDDQAASTSKASRVLSRKIVVGLAGILAVIASVTGDARYVNKEVVAKESVSEEVLLGCKVIKTFRGGQLQRPIPIGTSLTAESCTREIQYLSNPNAYLKMSYKVQGNLQDVVRTVPRRDWLAEFGVRGVRSIIGAVFGAVLAYLLITVRYKRQEILHALSSLGRVNQTHSHQIQSTITTTGGTAMTTESDMPLPTTSTMNASRADPVAKRNLHFDIKFNRFFTPIIVSVLYVICQVLIALGTFVLWIVYVGDFAIDGSSGFVVLTMLWTAPVFLFAALLVILLLRLTFESIMVRFRIAEDLRRIRDK